MKRYPLLLVVVILAVLLAGCAPATPQIVKEIVKETVVVEKEKVVQQTVVVEKQTEVTKVVEKQVVVTATPAPKVSAIRIGTTQDIRTLDPHKTTGSSDKPAFNIFNTLTRGGPNGQPIPELAESWETPDSKTYIFKLRKGVKFHNGREFVADDVIWSFNRVLDTATGSRYQAMLSQIDKMEATDKNTLKVTLKAPYAPFLVYLQDVRIMAKENLDQVTSKPIGTGPWTFVEWVPNDHLTLKKNADYWEKGLPKLDSVTYKIVRDKQSAMIAFKTGELDMLMDVGFVPQDLTDLTKTAGVYLATVPVESYYELILLDCEHAPTNDVRVRKAIAHALDRDLISQVVYDGKYPAAHTLFPPDHWAYNPYLLQPEYDLNKAKALFAEAGVKKLTFITWSVDPARKQIAEILQAELKKIGVEVEIQAVETAKLVEQVYPTGKTYQIANTAYLREIDPDGWLRYYYSNKASAGNETNYNNLEVDKLLIAARSELDQAKRKKLYDDVQKAILADMPKISLVFRKTYLPAQGYVKGLAVPYKGDEPYLREVTIEK